MVGPVAGGRWYPAAVAAIFERPLARALGSSERLPGIRTLTSERVPMFAPVR
jgi:hypothetical protein